MERAVADAYIPPATARPEERVGAAPLSLDAALAQMAGETVPLIALVARRAGGPIDVSALLGAAGATIPRPVSTFTGPAADAPTERVRAALRACVQTKAERHALVEALAMSVASATPPVGAPATTE